MENSTQKDKNANHYQKELKSALAGMDQDCSRQTTGSGVADAPSPLVLSMALAAAALIIAGVALSLIS